MKLGVVTKLDKRNPETSKKKKKKKIDDEVMSENCDVIIFPIYGQFGAIPSMIPKTYIFINSNLLSYKSWKQN